MWKNETFVANKKNEIMLYREIFMLILQLHKVICCCIIREKLELAKTVGSGNFCISSKTLWIVDILL